MKLRTKLKLFSYHINLDLYKENKLKDAVIGINSNIKNHCKWYEHHFLMIDYDNALSLENLITEIKRLQRKFWLGDCHIFESSYRHYNIMFFYEDMDYFHALQIIHDTPCCKSFKTWRMLRQEMTIRLSKKSEYDKKPKLIKIIRSRHKKELSKDQKKIMNFVLSYLEE